MDNALDVVGIGNAIVDVLAHVDDAFLSENGIAKGAMTLIGPEEATRLYGKMGRTVECSGGSAANTMVGLASLGGPAGYIGKVRGDGLGETFTSDIRRTGVEFTTPHAQAGPPTGRCLILVTPDGERSMQTFLGASAHLEPGDIDPYTISRARIVYLEGYLWDPAPAKQAFLRAARIAHEARCRVALSLSDLFCVDRHRSSFQDLVLNHIDILFANEAEIVALYQAATFDEAVACIKGKCEIAALTRGPKGSVIVSGDEVYEVAAEPVEQVVDTTGAGDLYAAGFLYGLTHDQGIVASARIGGITAGEVIAHVGARPQTRLADLVRDRLGSA